MPFGISPELVAIALFLGGLAVVLVSVETFIETAAETALTFGVSAFFLTAVLAGADVENAVIGLAAIFEGLSGLAIGTVFGEALFVLTVAVGLAGLLTPFETEVPHSYLLLIVGSPVLLVVLALDGTLSQFDGAVLTFAFVPAFGAIYALERNRETRYLAAEEVEGALEDEDDSDAMTDGSREPPADATLRERFAARYGGYYKLGVLVVASLGMAVGSQAAVMGARDLIAVFGIAGTAFGATVVGLISSLEELFLTVGPVREGRPDIGIGNVVGSMLFFVTANAGVIALVRPIPTAGTVLAVHFPFFIAALLVVGIIFWRGRVGRVDGVVLLGIYVAYWGANYLL
ncbi:sodium:calcium antiporter (plasmid) [Halococcus dombrowskii]|uniref:Sodium/hydrogen exchanger n=1 Tax=Halococcus dombrowskii TaxID=179637 RepID=A0AAV3SL75_HALDO|nr:sodium:calcium antiporter [Halococcus dombrowskii]UOO97026.1 sodium:calcium antiporter [Halococcus dombrowskii]